MAKRKTRVANLPKFDPAEHLRDEADIAAYLALVLEGGDAAELAHALGIIARARNERDRPGIRDHPRGAVQGVTARRLAELRDREPCLCSARGQVDRRAIGVMSVARDAGAQSLRPGPAPAARASVRRTCCGA